MASVVIEDAHNQQNGMRVTTSGRAHVTVQNEPTINLKAESKILSNAEKALFDEEMFMSSYHNIAVADDGYVQVMIEPGPQHKALCYVKASCGGDGVLSIYQSPTCSASGTGITGFNCDRSSTETTNATVWHTPTCEASGTLINTQIVPGIASEGVGCNAPIKLNVNTRYLFSLQNIAGSAKPASINIVYLEEAV